MDSPRPDHDSPPSENQFGLDLSTSLPPQLHPNPAHQQFAPFAHQSSVFLSDDLPPDVSVLHPPREVDLFSSPTRLGHARSSALSYAASQQIPTFAENPLNPQPPTQHMPTDQALLQARQFHDLRQEPRPVRILPGHTHPVFATPHPPNAPQVSNVLQARHMHHNASASSRAGKPAADPNLMVAPDRGHSAATALGMAPMADITPHVDRSEVSHAPLMPSMVFNPVATVHTTSSSAPAGSQRGSTVSSSSAQPSTSGRKRPPKVKAKAPQKMPTAEAVRLVATMDRPPTRRSSKGGWTSDEDDMLRVVVMEHKEKNWKEIAKALNNSFPGSNRNDVQCLHRWQKVLQPGLKKGPWSQYEDETITRLVAELGANKWSQIAKELPGRIGKQCRERWFNHLNPDINKDPWTPQEEQILKEAHTRIGNKWAVIAKYLPGRTDNAIKNHYNATQRRAATRKGRKGKAKATQSPTPSASEKQKTDSLESSAFQGGDTATSGLPSSIDNPLQDITNTSRGNGDKQQSEPVLKKRNAETVSFADERVKKSKPSTVCTAISKVTPHAPNDPKIREAPSVSPLKDILNENVLVDYISSVDNLLEEDSKPDDGSGEQPGSFSRFVRRVSPNGEGVSLNGEGVSPNGDGVKPTGTTETLDGSPEFKLRIPKPLHAPSRPEYDSVDGCLVTPLRAPQKRSRMIEPTAELRNSFEGDAPGSSLVRKDDVGDENMPIDANKPSVAQTGQLGPLLPFSTPPRDGLYAGVREPAPGGTTESPPGTFLLRPLTLDGTPGGGILGITPIGKSPGSLFLNSSPREGRGSIAGNLSSSRPGGLFTRGGLFGSSSASRGRLVPSPYEPKTSSVFGATSTTTPSKTGVTRELLPPLFSPQPKGSVSKRDAARSDGKDESMTPRQLFCSTPKQGTELAAGMERSGGAALNSDGDHVNSIEHFLAPTPDGARR